MNRTQTSLFVGIAALLLVGAGYWVWQTTQLKEVLNQNQPLNQSINFPRTESPTSTSGEVATENTLCSAGLDRDGNYPISRTYSELGVLGQIFTADDCGAARLQQTWGGGGRQLSYESVLFLKENPSPTLISLLLDLGFVCYGTSENPCRRWQNEGLSHRIDSLLGLKPYAASIDSEWKNGIVFKSTDNVCTVAPHSNEIGNVTYPIVPKYWNLNGTGQLLTAYDCGPTRFSQHGGLDTTQGGWYYLNKPASPAFRDTLKQLGFQCVSAGSESQCLEWQLENLGATAGDILKIRPYTDQIKAESCASCG